MNKKAIAILGVIFLLIVGTLGFLIYQKYSAKPTVVTVKNTLGDASSTTPATDSTANPVPAAGGAMLTKLSDEQVLSPVLFFDGTGITYFTPEGKLNQADLTINGTSVQLSRKRGLDIKIKSGISKILWPVTGRNFIAQQNTGIKKIWSFFNNSIGDYIDLPQQIASLDWAPQGDKIYYIWDENGKATLNSSDPDNKNWKFIATMWEQDDEIKVSPDGQNILYFETANTASSSNPIYLTTPDGKVWRTVVGDGYNFGVLWSPDSQKFIFSKKDKSSGNYQLWYANILTGLTKNLGIFTIPEKVVWSFDSKTIYAAAPTVGVAGTGQLTQDTVFRMNTDTFDRKEYTGFSQQVDVEDLLLTKDGSNLLFRNAQDGYLYYLGL